LGCILQKVISALEAFVKFGDSPRCYDLDGWLQSVKSQLETDLIIALSSATVGDELASFLLSNFNLGASDDRTSQGCAEQVDCSILSAESQDRESTSGSEGSR
jgi:hypothetical protein